MFMQRKLIKNYRQFCRYWINFVYLTDICKTNNIDYRYYYFLNEKIEN